MKEEQQTETQEETEIVEGEKGEENIDIDLDDPEVGAAATKIQAGYKGMRARKQVKKMKEDQNIETTEEEVVVEEEQIDIDLEDPEVGAAATKIQAGYKGMRARKEVKKMKEEQQNEVADDVIDQEEIDIDLEDPEVGAAATKIQAGYKGMRARKQVKQMKSEQIEVEQEVDDGLVNEEIDIDLEDPEVGAAATKIQAGYKGMRARKQVKQMKEEKIATDENVEGEENEATIDIDLDDPDVEAAATKIQAGYKGMQARKQVKKMKEEIRVEDEVEVRAEEEEVIDIDLDDPEVEAAANKIQASFKGMQARKKVKAEQLASEDAQQLEEVVPKEDEAGIAPQSYPSDADLAAARIQAGFRGMRTRKEITTRKKRQFMAPKSYSADADLAAARIQAGFRGMRARQEVNLMRTEVIHEIIEEEEEEGEEQEETEQSAEKADDSPGEEQATEMMIEGAAQAREEDEGARSQLDDGYISPENPTWRSSNTTCMQNSAPSSVNSSPTKHIDSSLSAAMAGNSLNLSSNGLGTNDCYDFDEDDTPRSILIEEQDIFEGGYEVFKFEEDQKESMSHFEETDTESQTVITDARLRVNDVEAPGDDFTDEEGQNWSQPPSLTSCLMLDEVAEDEAESGAIPFELHPSFNDPIPEEDDEDETDEKKMKEKSEESNFEFTAESVAEHSNKFDESPELPIIIYHSVGSYNCEKVLMYLHERSIPFEEHQVKLQNNEQVFNQR